MRFSILIPARNEERCLPGCLQPIKAAASNGTVGMRKSFVAHEFGARFLHQWITVAAAFENAWFEAAGAVGDFALRDL